MSEWTVTTTAATRDHLEEETLVALADAAEEWEATVARRGDEGPGFMLIVDVYAFHAHDAVDSSNDIIWKLSNTVDIPIEVVAVEARTPELAELEASRPDTPELLAATDVAELLGVSRQRVHQLARENAQFPAPYARVGSGPIWTRPAIEHFAGAWTRKPGRPAKVG